MSANDRQSSLETSLRAARVEVDARTRLVQVWAANVRTTAHALEDCIDWLGAALANREHPSAAIARYGISREAFRETSPMEMLRYPWLANHLIRSIERSQGLLTLASLTPAHYSNELEALKGAVALVESCGRAFRKALADQRRAEEDLAIAQDDWEVCGQALQGKAERVPGLSRKLSGGGK